MQKPKNLSDVLDLFNNYHFVINESPLLTNADIGGRDEEEVHLSWVDEENGGEYFLPFKNLEEADFNNGALKVEDEDGNLCDIHFYQLTPLTEARDRYVIFWTNEYDTGATYVFTVPKGTEIRTGHLEDCEPIVEGAPCIEEEILDQLGICFEPQKGESLHLSRAPEERCIEVRFDDL